MIFDNNVASEALEFSTFSNPSSPVIQLRFEESFVQKYIYHRNSDTEWNNFALWITISISLTAEKRGIFIYFTYRRGSAADKKTWGTTRGGGGIGWNRRREEKIYHRCWIIEQCTLARSHIPTSIPTQFCPRYYCLLADCRVRSGGGRGRRTAARARTCRREDPEV